MRPLPNMRCGIARTDHDFRGAGQTGADRIEIETHEYFHCEWQ